MTSKTIKISEENYKRLLNIASELQKQREERVSFDDALKIMEAIKMNGKKKKLSDLAGKWKYMTDKEANVLIKEIYKERKIISKRL
ncbi:hypothetical protein HYT25_03465 [Candidatus Pacearchaeota archaeon]|nr:hypothetical protein [Candidatus Pacearchaeota archaeon]